MHGRVKQLPTVLGGEPQHRERPPQNASPHVRERREREGLGDLRARHGEHVAAALEVVVAEDGAAHDGKVRVGPDEVVREGVHEVEQAP